MILPGEMVMTFTKVRNNKDDMSEMATSDISRKQCIYDIEEHLLNSIGLKQ